MHLGVDGVGTSKRLGCVQLLLHTDDSDTHTHKLAWRETGAGGKDVTHRTRLSAWVQILAPPFPGCMIRHWVSHPLAGIRVVPMQRAAVRSKRVTIL